MKYICGFLIVIFIFLGGCKKTSVLNATIQDNKLFFSLKNNSNLLFGLQDFQVIKNDCDVQISSIDNCIYWELKPNREAFSTPYEVFKQPLQYGQPTTFLVETKPAKKLTSGSYSIGGTGGLVNANNSTQFQTITSQFNLLVKKSGEITLTRH